MKHTQKYLNDSSDKEFFLKQIANLSDKQKGELENLVVKLENAGAKKPLSWAISEVTENIPQFGRFLVLRSLWKIANSVEGNISLAGDFDDTVRDKFESIKEKIGEDLLTDILSSYSKGLICSLVDFLDEGNSDIDRDKTSWILMKTDENSEPTGQIIQGLHEDLLEFENEIKI
tara:strand:- start:152 stop:673 length:522 start_codon:yes stop_codon:yes gene_type:complete